MTLLALIRKRDTGKLATAIPAIPAIPDSDSTGNEHRIARIAKVAVANPEEVKPATPAPMKKLDSEKCAPCVLSKVPKPLLAVKTVPTGHVFGKQGPAKVGADTPAAVFDQEWFEERAGILEYDAGFTRQEAERRAYLEVTK